MPWVERDDGARLWWDARGDGPSVLFAHGYIQDPLVYTELLDQLAAHHRLVTYDPRGAGQSSRQGPYDMATDVADLEAVLEAAGPVAAVMGNGDASNRTIHLAARRADLVPAVVAMETVPLAPGSVEGTEALVGSAGVLGALLAMMRADYRSGLSAAIERGNPNMPVDQLRARIDQTAAYIGPEAGVGRLEAWIRDDAAGDAHSLGDRLVIAYEGAGAWFPAELHDRAREVLPDARFERLEGGAVSRPDLTADVVRQVTGA